MKIERMSVEEIKNLLRDYPPEKVGHYTFQRLALTWAQERARGLSYRAQDSPDANNFYKTDSDWLSEVLAEIGWPEER